MLDRSTPPAAQEIEHFEIPLPETIVLDNGIPLFAFNLAEQEVIKVEFVFKAGTCYEEVPGTSYLASKLLLEGTSKRTSSEIASQIDYYGAFVESSSGFDYLTLTVYSLNKHLNFLLEIVDDCLRNATFPEKEFELLRKVKKQDLLINEGKNNLVASKLFRHNLMGNHPYGYILKPEDMDLVTRQDCKDFYSQHLFKDPEIFICGKFGRQTISTLNNTFGDLDFSIANREASTPKKTLGTVNQTIDDSLQSSIRIGNFTLNRNHKDIHSLAITNSIFGGYFGSRLMKNIREDKGYTYGIYSSIAHLHDASFFVISTDVKKEFTSHTIDEIHKEISILKTESVSTSELETVSKYLAGQFLSNLDSPFSIASKFKSVHQAGLDYTFYYDYLAQLKTINADKVLEMANKYFDTEEFIQVVVG